MLEVGVFNTEIMHSNQIMKTIRLDQNGEDKLNDNSLGSKDSLPDAEAGMFSVGVSLTAEGY